MADKKRVSVEMKNEISAFDADKLKHAETVEKNVLPSPDDINQEKTLVNIQEFDKNALKHADTVVKNPLPDQKTIEAEKRISQSS